MRIRIRPTSVAEFLECDPFIIINTGGGTPPSLPPSSSLPDGAPRDDSSARRCQMHSIEQCFNHPSLAPPLTHTHTHTHTCMQMAAGGFTHPTLPDIFKASIINFNRAGNFNLRLYPTYQDGGWGDESSTLLPHPRIKENGNAVAVTPATFKRNEN